jgi:hypothetical protein
MWREISALQEGYSVRKLCNHMSKKQLLVTTSVLMLFTAIVIIGLNLSFLTNFQSVVLLTTFIIVYFAAIVAYIFDLAQVPLYKKSTLSGKTRSLTPAEVAQARGWTIEKFLRVRGVIPDWEVGRAMGDAAAELELLRRNADHAQAAGVAPELMDKVRKEVNDAFEVLWRRAGRIGSIAEQRVARREQRKDLPAVVQYEFDSIAEKLSREVEKLQQLLHTARQTREWVAGLTLAGEGFEAAEIGLASLIEATRELEEIYNLSENN